MGKTVAEKKGTEVGAVIDYEQFAGAGLENAEAEDYAIPFIYIVQKNSKVIDTDEDAKPGMFFNNVTGELYKELLAIPCEFEKEYVEWVPHDDGGGYKGRHDWDSGILDQCNQDDRGKWFLENGHQIVDTRKHYVLIINPETGEIFPALITMTSTQAKKSRRWLSTMGNRLIELTSGKKIQAPTFAYMYRLSTVQESKDKNTWYGWVVQKMKDANDGKIMDEGLFLQAYELHKSIKLGDVKEASPEQE